MSSKSKTPIVLASTSPRRIELLRQIGIQVRTISPAIDESPRRGEKPRALVSRLAHEKAASVATQLHSSPALVIAADTIVIAPNGKTILGKPADQADARKTLKMLAGKTHTVLTGYCIYPAHPENAKTKPVIRVISSRVKFRPLSAKDIQHYVDSGEPMDKAGSYAIQGIGMALVERISGNYTNVVGLPICQLARDLEEIFGLTLFTWN
jgi:septum formation protein